MLLQMHLSNDGNGLQLQNQDLHKIQKIKKKIEIKCSKNLIWEIFDKESFNDAKKGAKTNSPLLKGRGPGQKMWLKQEDLLKSASREVEDSLYSGFAIFKTAKKLIFTIVFTFQHQSRNI